MNDQAFQLLMIQLEKHFAEDLAFQNQWREHADKVEEKLDNLFAFKWKVIGASSLASFIITILTKVLVK